MHTNHKRNQFHLFKNTFCISFVSFSNIKFTFVVVCWLLANIHKLNCQIINTKPLIYRFWRTIIFESSSTRFQSWGNFYCSNNVYISSKETQLQNHSCSRCRILRGRFEVQTGETSFKINIFVLKNLHLNKSDIQYTFDR